MSKTYNEIKTNADAIKNASTKGYNSASRVGQQFGDTIDFSRELDIDINGGVRTELLNITSQKGYDYQNVSGGGFTAKANANSSYTGDATNKIGYDVSSLVGYKLKVECSGTPSSGSARLTLISDEDGNVLSNVFESNYTSSGGKYYAELTIPTDAKYFFWSAYSLVLESITLVHPNEEGLKAKVASITDANAKIGNLSNLTTTKKTDVVSSINEVVGKPQTITSKDSIDLNDSDVWEVGGISNDTGGDVALSRVRTKGMFKPTSDSVFGCSVNPSWVIYPFLYSNDGFIGVEQTSAQGYIINRTVYSISWQTILAKYPTAVYVRFVCAYTSSVDTLLSTLTFLDTAYQVNSTTIEPSTYSLYGLSQNNVLFGKKWCVVGDSFSYNGYTSSEINQDCYIQDGKFKGQYRTYKYVIGNRNNMSIVDMSLNGRTMAYPDDGTFSNAFANPSMYQSVPTDADYVTIMLGINDINHSKKTVDALPSTDDIVPYLFYYVKTDKTSSSGQKLYDVYLANADKSTRYIGEMTLTTDGEDYTGTITLGTINDTTTSTYYGAWNVVLEWLITNLPYAHIGIIVTNGTNDDALGVGYHKAQIDVAKKWGVPYLDINGDAITPMMHRGTYPSELCSKAKELRMSAFRISESNGHPNWKAHEYESTFIEDFLRRL